MNHLNMNASFMHRSLLNMLRGGGYILYVRHGEANIGEDQPYLNLQDCTTQRNLSVKGIRQAIRYGELLRKLQIPLAIPIISSPYCRTSETAVLAFGIENVWIDSFWVNIQRLNGNLSREEQKGILNSLKLVLERPPIFGTNQVIIAHSFPKELGLGKIPYMGTVIVKPHGVGMGYEVIGKLTLNEIVEESNLLD